MTTRTRHPHHVLYHFHADGTYHECVLMPHALKECKVCLFACHIDRGDWILSKLCPVGRRLLDKEECQLDHGEWSN